MQARDARVLAGWAIVLAAAWAGPAPAAPGRSTPAVTVSACAGKPFGVGAVTLALPPVNQGGPSHTGPEYLSAFRLVSKGGRVLYPVCRSLPRSTNTPGRSGPNRPKTRPAGMGAPPGGLAAHFLFKGSTAFDVTLIDATGARERVYTARVVPADNAERHAALLDAYWGALKDRVQGAVRADMHLPAAENYVLAMLSRRLNRQIPELQSRWVGDGLNGFVGVLIGAESVKLAMQRRAVLGDADAGEKADRPLPEPVLSPSADIPRAKGPVPVEPIAMRVPVECFYVRFGSYRNYRRARRLLERWGAMVRDLPACRSADWGLTARLEKQLVLVETAVVRLFGGRLVSDMAVVGSDAFVGEGASLGVLFEARSSLALGAQLRRRRAEAVRADPAVAEKTVLIAGRKVSLVWSPDHAVRSFYAVDGDYHLVATSRTLVRRFFEAAAGTNCLGSSREFRRARSAMPLARNDTVFVYLSEAFFSLISSPAYHVEMTRRMRSLSKMRLVSLARQAARSEGRKADSVQDLIAGDFLPPGFRTAPDGSTIRLAGGRAVDSLRGAAGTFLPAWDVEITTVTPTEAKAYKAFADAYRNEWERAYPVTAGFRHVPKTRAGNERVVMDLVVAPYARKPLARIDGLLGKPVNTRIAPVAGNLVSVEAIGRRVDMLFDPGALIGKPAGKAPARPQRLFAGLRDGEIPFTIARGAVHVSRTPRHLATVKAYAGETPDVRWLRWLAGGLFGRKPDKNGYYRPQEEDGIAWGRKSNSFHVLAPNRETLDRVCEQLRIVPAERPAQVRLHVKPLREAAFAPLLRAAAYVQARRASAGNALMLRAISHLLNASPDRAAETARRVLGAEGACPLGGTYRPDGRAGGLWLSSAWPERRVDEIARIPEAFRFAPLGQFAGLVLEFAIDRQQRVLRAHLELDIAPDRKDR